MKNPVSRGEVTKVFVQMVNDKRLTLMSFLKQE